MLKTSTNIHGAVDMSTQTIIYSNGWYSHNFVFTDDKGETFEVSVFSAKPLDMRTLETRSLLPVEIPVGEATEVA